MEQQFEAMQQMIALAETGLEGIQHIKSQLNADQFEGTASLFGDVIEAYYHIEGSLQLLASPANNPALAEAARSLRSAMEHTTTSFEAQNGRKTLEVVQFTLQPAYLNWKSELEQACSPYLVS